MNGQINQQEKQKNGMGVMSLILGLPVTLITNITSMVFFAESCTSERFPSESELEELLSSSHTGVAFAIIGVIAGILAIVAAVAAIKKKNAKKGAAITGIIFGAIGFVFAIIFLGLNVIQGNDVSNVMDRLY
ncbi:MAG: hypothetical protein ACI4GW_07180 [Lachnospiraceae bacterium]